MFYGSQESCNNRTLHMRGASPLTRSFPCGRWLQTREGSLGGGRGRGSPAGPWAAGRRAVGFFMRVRGVQGAAGCGRALSPGSRLWEAGPGRRERKRKTEAPQLAFTELPSQLGAQLSLPLHQAPAGHRAVPAPEGGSGRAGESTGSSAGTAAWQGRPSGEEKGAGRPPAGSLGLPQLEAGPAVQTPGWQR